ncbi:MAG: hypothetical protein ACSLE5_07390 [Porticoccaceae bacterium]
MHFATQAQEYFGVDIASASLDECRTQLESAGLRNFTPVLIDAACPEAAREAIQNPCDLFLSMYVFKLLPSPEYGLRILKIAYELLSPGGLAFIQIRYITSSWKSAPRGWGYKGHIPHMTAYRIEEFWEAAQDAGFTPRIVKLLPKQPLNSGNRYAYFLLQK